MERKNGEFLAGTSGRGLYALSGDSLKKVPGGYTTGTGNWYYNQMMEDSQGRFWKCGYGEEVTMKDHAGVHQFFVEQGIVVCLAEMDGDILIIGLHGISRYHNGKMMAADIDMTALGGTDVVMCSGFQDHNGDIYIGTRGAGLFLLRKGGGRLERVECGLHGMDLNTAKIWCIRNDRRGNIWLGCQSKGLVMIPRVQPQFSAWSFSAQGYRLSSSVTSVCEGDESGVRSQESGVRSQESGVRIWCTVQGSGVFGFDSHGRIVAHPAAPAAAEFIFRDRQGRYWIGNDEGLYAYDPQTGRKQRRASFTCEKVNGMTDVGNGYLYVSTYSRGFCAYHTEEGTVRNFLATQTDAVRGALCNNWVLAMMPDRHGRIWLATASGTACYDPQKDSFRPYGWDCLLDGMMCYSLCETKGGDILIGTDQGLFCYHAGDQEAKRFGYGDGLADKTVGYIVEANNGDIWCATSMGIWQFDKRREQFIGHVSGNGLTMKEYVNCVGMHIRSQESGVRSQESGVRSQESGVRSQDDRICFANNDGLVAFSPDGVTGSHKDLPAVKLTGFYIAGQPVNALTKSDGRMISDGPVIETDNYVVSYLDNSVTLEFSLLDFNSPRNIIYEYRINNARWLQTREGENSVQLSHLQPGTYQIEVRALSAGVCSETKTIFVEVTPPWYRSGWAYMIYLMGVMGIVGMMGWMWKRSANQQLDEEKMKFLINATHDIRSPLTLIMGGVGKLKNLKIKELKDLKIEELRNEAEAQALYDRIIGPPVETIDRNAQRLMLLVNQILDERRIDKHQMQLHCRETNMVDFISGICKLYQYNANQRNITFTFEHDKDHVLAWVDRIHFDKVVSNLLSNAFKYTFDGGEVKVVLREQEKDIEIKVTDNGTGIKEEDKERLFTRFYQGRNSDDLGMQGTGIGLNLSLAIAQLHGGKIKADNRSDGQGACFTVTLPKGNSHLKGDQIVTDSPAREVLSDGHGDKRRFRQFKILVVDDDQEIADYIINELGSRYKFNHAPNGKEGLKMLLTEDYDLVVSDVMMPEMDGLTLLKRIKDNPQISEIPVIMLTSKAEVEHKLEGLKSGADAYIAKPFSMEELHIQIDNLIDNVRRLRGKFSGAVRQEKRVENIEVKSNDDALMERVMRSVNAHLSDPDFNIDALASDVGISRAQLHRRMKEITGISSGKFLRNLRMEQAARLLREGAVNVSQVADRVGYDDRAHFSTAFKAHFGQSPTEYAESCKDK